MVFMATPATSFSKDFSLYSGIFKTTQITVAGSTDANALQAILADDKFPAGDIELGHISFTADTGDVSLKPIAGTAVSFDIKASAQSGVGVYGKAATALGALKLGDAPAISIPNAADDERYLLLDYGLSASVSG